MSNKKEDYTSVYMEVEKCNKMIEILMWVNQRPLFYYKKAEMYENMMENYNICLKNIIGKKD
jgi:hypothetical protein